MSDHREQLQTAWQAYDGAIALLDEIAWAGDGPIQTCRFCHEGQRTNGSLLSLHAEGCPLHAIKEKGAAGIADHRDAKTEFFYSLEAELSSVCIKTSRWSLVLSKKDTLISGTVIPFWHAQWGPYFLVHDMEDKLLNRAKWVYEKNRHPDKAPDYSGGLQLITTRAKEAVGAFLAAEEGLSEDEIRSRINIDSQLALAQKLSW